MSHYVVPRSTYYIVFVLLIVLLVLTALVAQYDLDTHLGVTGVNVTVALAIAVAKAALIVLFFMQIKYATALQRIVAGSGVLFLAILLTITFSDYISRGSWWTVPTARQDLPGDLQEPPGRAAEMGDPDDPAD